MKKYIIPFMALTLLTTSCSDWLDVRGENIQKEQDQFYNYKGFRDALTGCYMTMGSTNIYGEKLTMTDIENLAGLWNCDDNEESIPLQYALTNHQYTKDKAREAIKAIYGGLFKTISSANVLLKNLDEKGGNIPSAQNRDMIAGEAYAIRAYCQLDVLRLFGQMPKNGTKTVSLPYSYTTNIGDMPTYYDYAAYVQNLTSDIEKAESLLKSSDPVMKSSFSNLNTTSSVTQDDFLNFRQSRLNYWAVRALHARMALYIGKTDEAHRIAVEIINATNSDGTPVIQLSGIKDLRNGYNALPGETLFYLSKYDVNTYANKLLIGGLSTQARNFHYLLSDTRLNELFASIPGATASHNRYMNLWNRTLKNPLSQPFAGLKKYWFDESKASASQLMTSLQIVPMLRLSEVYLIAMETSQSLDEILSLYKTYMTDREYTLYTPFKSIDEAKTEMLNEIRRELIGEGQMFYAYKRLGLKTIKWSEKQMADDDYILPLPSSEYNPNPTKK